jgi:hypothetical protein
MANCVPVGPISYTVLTAPAAGAAAGSVVIVTSPGSAPAGMLTPRLPSDDVSAPPDGPTFIIVGAPPPAGLPVLLPQPAAASVSVNEQKIDVWREEARIANTNRSLRRRIERGRVRR